MVMSQRLRESSDSAVWCPETGRVAWWPVAGFVVDAVSAGFTVLGVADRTPVRRHRAAFSGGWH